MLTRRFHEHDAALRTDFYHLPLPVVLTDSTHGEMKYFELVTVRLTGIRSRTLCVTNAVNKRKVMPRTGVKPGAWLPLTSDAPPTS